MNKNMRESTIINLWLQRPPEERKRNHVVNFYGWLEQNRPDLLPVARKGKDPYQKLQAILTNHVRKGS
jgi:hypothetical protein